MSDLISRQAAIDAVAEIVSSMSVCLSIDECHGMKRMQGLAVRALEQLPSAQPEIIRCNDCDYWNERQGRMYCGEMYFDQDDPNFYCGYARRRTDG